MANNWIEALKQWNSGKGTFCCPKKGSKEYDRVKKIQNKLDKENGKVVKKTPVKKAPIKKAPAPAKKAPVKKTTKIEKDKQQDRAIKRNLDNIQINEQLLRDYKNSK